MPQLGALDLPKAPQQDWTRPESPSVLCSLQDLITRYLQSVPEYSPLHVTQFSALLPSHRHPLWDTLMFGTMSCKFHSSQQL